jgi:hypothetical protein
MFLADSLLCSTYSYNFFSSMESNSDLRRFWIAASICGAATYSDFFGWLGAVATYFSKVLIFSSSFCFSDLYSNLFFRIMSLIFLADSLLYSSNSFNFCSRTDSYYYLSLPYKAVIICWPVTWEVVTWGTVTWGVTWGITWGPAPDVLFCYSSAS